MVLIEVAHELFLGPGRVVVGKQFDRLERADRRRGPRLSLFPRHDDAPLFVESHRAECRDEAPVVALAVVMDLEGFGVRVAGQE